MLNTKKQIYIRLWKLSVKILTVTQRNELLKLLHKFEELFDGTLGTWKTYPADFKLKEDAKPI